MLRHLFERLFGTKPVQNLIVPETLSLEVSIEISPNDTMYQVDSVNYFDWGKWTLDSVELALKNAEKREVKNILDLPCGHGRAMRYFKVAFPDAALTACDIEKDGVDFCVKAFGAKGVYSSRNPAEIQLDEKFDLIWVGSLLTHLDQDLWRAFLQFFNDHLAKDGVFVFTTHGECIVKHLREKKERLGLCDFQLARILEDYDSVGFGYSDYSGHDDYGVSISSPEWVENLLKAFPNLQPAGPNPVPWGSKIYAQDGFAYIQTA